MTGPSTLALRIAWLALTALLALPHLAPAQAETAEEAQAAEREALFAVLAGTRDEAEARAAESAIWRLWLQAPDAEAQALLDQALERRRWHDFAGALPHLDTLIAAYPDYAEGWNQRATIRFLRGEYDASLADIAEVLKREPKHFGALAGRALILMHQGKDAQAQLALIEALAINPWLRERGLLIAPDEKL